ncbi:FHA domain-containing protein [Jonesiaceae bacterium BS-20]|uniref:FHA domain-containing protein n=1 Tax=Jonesiaceae bacterium BS-20 TaxID=3120821 RepID=A0AAU7DZY6_9MICO
MSDQVPNPAAAAESEPEPTAQLSDSTITLSSIGALDEAYNAAGTSQDVRNIVNGLPKGSGLLVVRTMAGEGERFLLDRDQIRAGRSEKADIFLNDVTVSRRHSEFVRVGDNYEIRDAGSLNGTYINRDRVDSYTLRTGDEIQIGKYRMVFYISPLSLPSSGTAPQSGQ